MGDTLIKEVNEIFHCDVMAKNRKRTNVDGRIAVGNYLRKSSKMTFLRIAAIMKKDHATIMHYVRMHKNLYKYNAEYRKKYDLIMIQEQSFKLICNPCTFQFNKISA